MYFVEQAADKFTRWSGDGDSTSANPDMMLDNAWNLAFASFRGSLPDHESPTFPKMGDMIVSELCSWDFDKTIERLELERSVDRQYAIVCVRQTLEQDLGWISLSAIGNARDKTSLFVVSGRDRRSAS